MPRSFLIKSQKEEDIVTTQEMDQDHKSAFKVVAPRKKGKLFYIV